MTSLGVSPPLLFVSCCDASRLRVWRSRYLTVGMCTIDDYDEILIFTSPGRLENCYLLDGRFFRPTFFQRAALPVAGFEHLYAIRDGSAIPPQNFKLEKS